MYNRKIFDVVIPVIKNDLLLVLENINKIDETLQPSKIVLIGSNEIESMINEKNHIIFIDEDNLIEGLDLKSIKQIICKITRTNNRSGWYYQQFLKMAYAYVCESEYYIVWDADTIPLNPINFFDKDGRYFFTMKKEYHKPYFDTIEKIFSGRIRKYNDQSFIAEHMIIDKKIMLEMIKDIEINSSLNGTKFFEKILYAIPPNEIQASGYSEFETYGNYVMYQYSEKYTMRQLRTLREGVKFLGETPTTDQLVWASKDYDIVSIEKADKISKFSVFSRYSILFKFYSLKTIVSMRNRIRSLYRLLLMKDNNTFD